MTNSKTPGWGCGHDCRDASCTGCKVVDWSLVPASCGCPKAGCKGMNDPKLPANCRFKAPRKPKLLILGHGRHGKDTVAEILRDHHGFSFASSSFFAAEMVVRPALAACGVTYDTLEECYADRVNYRSFWYEAISAYNRGGTSRLAEAILVDHDAYVGMRSNREFEASRKLFDIVVWVDATLRGLPLEPTSSLDIVYDPKTMALIDNNGTLEDLREEVAAFATALSYVR